MISKLRRSRWTSAEFPVPSPPQVYPGSGGRRRSELDTARVDLPIELQNRELWLDPTCFCRGRTGPMPANKSTRACLRNSSFHDQKPDLVALGWQAETCSCSVKYQTALATIAIAAWTCCCAIAPAFQLAVVASPFRCRSPASRAASTNATPATAAEHSPARHLNRIALQM